MSGASPPSTTTIQGSITPPPPPLINNNNTISSPSFQSKPDHCADIGTTAALHVPQGQDGPSSCSIMVKSYEKTRSSASVTSNNIITTTSNTTTPNSKDSQENYDDNRIYDMRVPGTANTTKGDQKQGVDIDADIGISINDADQDVGSPWPADTRTSRIINTSGCRDPISALPDELILRIISLAGNATHQMRTAFALGNTCRRLRRVLLTAYLPSIHRFTQDSLNALGLSDTARATAALRAALSLTTSIRTLTLEGPPPQVFTADCFAALSIAACDKLRTVNLAYSYLTDDCVKPLLANCTRLEELALCSCSNMTGEAFSAVGGDNIGNIRAPIRSLDLSYMHLLDVEALQTVASITTIQHIKLAGCSNVNNDALKDIALGPVRNSLTHVNLKCCPVNDNAIGFLVTRCPKLEKIVLAKHHDNLWETGYYTEAVLQLIHEHFPNVEVVIEN